MNTMMRRVATAGIVAFAVLVSGVASASAANGGLEFLSSFNASDNPAFPSGFSDPEGLIVDQSNQQVYVTDQQTTRPRKEVTEYQSVIDIFNPAGAFQSEIKGLGDSANGAEERAVAVNDATGRAYAIAVGSHESVINVYSAAGLIQETWDGSATSNGSFGAGVAMAIAVDNSTQSSAGDVYVLDRQQGVVDRFDASGSPVSFTALGSYIQGSQLTGSPEGSFTGLESVAVDQSNGDLYVGAFGAVDVFSPTGEYLFDLRGGPPLGFPQGIAVDGATGETYVAGGAGEGVYVFDASGVFQYRVLGTPQGPFVSLRGIGVDEATGDVYVVNRGDGSVAVFRPGPLPAAASVEPASGVTSTSATLNGDFDPEGVNTGFYFLYAKGSSCFGGSASAAGSGSGGSIVHEEAMVSGLEPHTEYSFCLETTTGQMVRTSLDSSRSGGWRPAGEF